jgi:hypothetical protein
MEIAVSRAYGALRVVGPETEAAMDDIFKRIAGLDAA